jgi:hypothetical protein
VSFLLHVYLLFYVVCFTPMRFPRVKAEVRVFTTAFPEWSTVNSFSRPPATVPRGRKICATNGFNGSRKNFDHLPKRFCVLARPIKERERRSACHFLYRGQYFGGSAATNKCGERNQCIDEESRHPCLLHSFARNLICDRNVFNAPTKNLRQNIDLFADA